MVATAGIVDGSIPSPLTAYDDPPALGADEALTSGSAIDPRGGPGAVGFHRPAWPFGEDGTVQALCETAGLVYTGAGVAASTIGMDKAIFKQMTGAMGMPVVPWTELSAAEWEWDPMAAQRRIADFLGALPDPGS